MTRILCALLVALGLLAPAALRSQESDNPGQKKISPTEDIFSGTVTALKPDSVTVMRKIAGQPAVTRTFTLDPQTKIEGQLKARVRVTVRFASEEGLYTAVFIIVR